MPLLAAGSTQPAARAELMAYAEAVLQRFRNPAMRHRLAQIAGDGTQKLPVRVLAPLREALAADADVDRFAMVLAAWLRFVRVMTQQGLPITDPMAAELHALGQTLRDEPGDIDRALALRAVFPPDLAQHPRVRAALAKAYRTLLDQQAPPRTASP